MLTVADLVNASDMHAFELVKPSSIDFSIQQSHDLHLAMFADVGEPPKHKKIELLELLEKFHFCLCNRTLTMLL